MNVFIAFLQISETLTSLGNFIVEFFDKAEPINNAI